jgi:hypothetical protein
MTIAGEISSWSSAAKIPTIKIAAPATLAIQSPPSTVPRAAVSTSVTTRAMTPAITKMMTAAMTLGR